MKEDLRILKTKDNIRYNFIHLLAQYQFQEITIKLLTNQCRINKSTFYRHYQDKYALVEDIVTMILDRYKKSLKTTTQFHRNSSREDYETYVISLVDFFEENKETLLILESKTLPVNIFQDMFEILSQEIFNQFSQDIGNLPILALYSKLISNNILTSLKWWHKENPSLSKEDIKKLIIETISTGIQSTLENHMQ